MACHRLERAASSAGRMLFNYRRQLDRIDRKQSGIASPGIPESEREEITKEIMCLEDELDIHSSGLPKLFGQELQLGGPPDPTTELVEAG